MLSMQPSSSSSSTRAVLADALQFHDLMLLVITPCHCTYAARYQLVMQPVRMGGYSVGVLPATVLLNTALSNNRVSAKQHIDFMKLLIFGLAGLAEARPLRL